MSVSLPVREPVLLDAWLGQRLRLGVIALATDHSSEAELWQMAPPGEVELFVTRVLNQNPTTIENLRAMAPRLTEAASILLPGSDLDAMIYSCTSGTAVIGAKQVEERIQAAKPGVPCTTPLTAAAAAFGALAVSRIAVLTPYVDEVNQTIKTSLLEAGAHISSFLSFGMESDVDMALIPAQTLIAAAVETDTQDAEALFISCTALRTVGIVEELESRLGKPVVTSNQAMFWHALRLAGYTRHLDGFGQLLRT
jgi:maleate isomerase